MDENKLQKCDIKKLGTSLTELGFINAKSDISMFIQHTGDLLTIMLICVGDIMSLSTYIRIIVSKLCIIIIPILEFFLFFIRYFTLINKLHGYECVIFLLIYEANFFPLNFHVKFIQ